MALNFPPPIGLVAKSGVAAFSPASVTGLIGWESDYGTFQERTGASATTPATADTDPIGTWASKYGAASYWTAPSDAARPTNQTNELNSLAVVRADGTDDGFEYTGSGFPTNFTIIAVVKKAAAGSTQMLVRSNYAVDDGQCFISAADKFQALGGVTASAFTVTDWNIIQFARTGTSGVTRINGGAGEALTFTSNTDTDLDLFGGAGFPMACDCAAFYIANTDLSIANLNNMGTYLNSKYGLTWNTAS